MVFESTVFRLNEKCFDLCIPANNFSQLAKLDEGESQQYFEVFQGCIEGCAKTYMKTHEYVKSRFLEDYKNTLEENEKIYTSYLK